MRAYWNHETRKEIIVAGYVDATFAVTDRVQTREI